MKMTRPHPIGNLDPATVEGFGREWASFDQTALDEDEHRELFEAYFSVFPFDTLPADAEGFDLGCGSGRWAAGIIDRVGTLHCIDPSAEALAVARRRLSAHHAARFHNAGVADMPLADASQDFGYSLGVLHHVPDTAAAIADCVRKLKPGAPLLLYLYYSLDFRPAWFRAAWRASDLIRRFVSRLPFPLRKGTTGAIALTCYWPLARLALAAEKVGADVSNVPLSAYRHLSFYTMRTDALDRFGTRLEQRFSRDEIERMMRDAGLVEIRFRDGSPYWVACGRRALNTHP
jgi:ubiquinone/menaquinone biosynthesis C-methylase UbiE